MSVRQLWGVPFPAAVVDLSSAFPAIAHLLGWWPFLCAERIGREDVTDELRVLCQSVAFDPTAVLDPSIWVRFGFTLVEVLPDGEPFPVEIEDERRPDGRMEVVPVFSGRPMFFAWPDVVAAAALSGRVPHIVGADRLVPSENRQPRLRRRLAVRPGLVLDVDDDPVVALFAARANAKARQDLTLAAELRVVLNSLAFGGFARFDPTPWRENGKIVAGERPGPWTFLPIASSVTAGARLLLAVLDRLVRDRGGLIAYRDTDSSIIPAAPVGGTLLRDGPTIRLLSWNELDDVLAAFDTLSPFGADVPMWKVERGNYAAPLRSIVFGTKRHVEFVTEGNLRIVERTEANLGGFYVDPAKLRGRAHDGKRRWTFAAIEREVTSLSERENDSSRRRGLLPWDIGSDLPFPALRRLTVTTPEILRSLPTELGAHLGSRYLAPVVDTTRLGFVVIGSPVALDPGDDLANWHALSWLARYTGLPLRVTVDPDDRSAVLVVALADKAREWYRPVRAEPIAHVTINPLDVRHKGRVSGLIDAVLDGRPGDLLDDRPIYDRPVRVCELLECERPVHGRKRYCCRRHENVARMRRSRWRNTAQ